MIRTASNRKNRHYSNVGPQGMAHPKLSSMVLDIRSSCGAAEKVISSVPNEGEDLVCMPSVLSGMPRGEDAVESIETSRVTTFRKLGVLLEVHSCNSSSMKREVRHLLLESLA